MATNKPKPIPNFSSEESERFWNLVDKRGPDECWPWLGATFQSGYGRFSLKRDSQNEFKSSRIALFLTTGVDPGPNFACHSCDNPPCCNPTHLAAKPPLGNSTDMKERGRTAKGLQNGAYTKPGSVLRGDDHWTRKKPEFLHYGKDHWTNQHPEWISGEWNPAAKVTIEQVRAMRALAAEGITGAEIGRRFNLTRSTACRIIARKSWTHVD